MKKWVLRVAFILFVTILFILSYSYYWGVREFSGIDFQSIVFQLSVPLKGTSSDILDSFITNALFPALKKTAVVLLISSLYWLLHRYSYSIEIIFRNKNKIITLPKVDIPTCVFFLVIILWAEVIWIYVDRAFGLNNYIVAQTEDSPLIENEYISPTDVAITFPPSKRNLIWILMESAETSAQSEGEGGIQIVNYIPEMTDIANENVSFSQSNLLEGAAVAPGNGWTMGGIVGQTAGVPLKTPIGGNNMGKYKLFMPKLVNIGNILESENYHNYFMCGSDVSFAGQDNYFIQHGNYEIFDYYSAIEEKKIDSDYKVWWGYEDKKLYSFAKEKILELAKEDVPFNFMMCTIDTHSQNGYVCDLCSNKYSSQYGNVWSCASKQVSDFVNWIKEQDFYENTTVVITGDHLSMDSNFYAGFDCNTSDGSGTKRKVYNVFINASLKPAKEKNRKFTTIDMFPTILASIGAEIKGNRLGLGTNLFSEEQTLSEKYGYEYLFEELNKNSNYYNDNILY